MKTFYAATALILAAAVCPVAAYWWANTPPTRPDGVSLGATFLWSGHLGLPAPKHGTWIVCWFDRSSSTDICRLNGMDGTLLYEGSYIPDPLAAPTNREGFKIEAEATGDKNHWISLGGLAAAPLVFLDDGVVLIPKDAYSEGRLKLNQIRGVGP